MQASTVLYKQNTAHIDPLSIYHYIRGTNPSATESHIQGMLLYQKKMLYSARIAFKISAKKNSPPWSLLSYRELLWTYFKENQWNTIISIQKKHPQRISAYKDFFYFSVAALYHTRKYGQLLKLFKTIQIKQLKDLPWNRITATQFSSKQTLWRIIAMIELKDSHWEDLLHTFILSYPASIAHIQLFQYLRNKKIDTHMLTLLEIKNHSAQNEYKQVLTTFQNYYGPYFLLSKYIIKDIWNSSTQLRIYVPTAKKLQELIKNNPSPFIFEYIGKLYLKAKQFKIAHGYFKKASENNNHQSLAYRRRQWYWFISGIRENPSKIFLMLSSLQDVIAHYPRYFTDAFDELLQVFLMQKDWNLIKKTFHYLVKNGSLSSQAQYALVLSCVSQGKEKRSLLKLVYKQTEHLYFHALAAALLRLPLKLPPVQIPHSPQPSNTSDLSLLKTYVDAQLFSYAERIFRTRSSSWTDSQLYEASDLMITIGNPHVVLSALSAQSDYTNYSFLIRYYPRAFWNIVRKQAYTYNIPAYLLLAIAREESRFSPTVRSAAGAVGIMQILPSTATEVAKKEHIDIFDLTSVTDNFHLGSIYLTQLIKKWSTFSLSLAAYNAGSHRLSSWIKEYSYSPILFVEAIPFRETRRYVRKVLSSYIYYQYIFHTVNMRDIMNESFGTYNCND